MTKFEGRRTFRWSAIRNPKDGIVVVLATAFGTGLLPKAPGTWGTLVTLPLVAWASSWPLGIRAGFWAFLLMMGCWIAQEFDRLMKSRDHSNFVLDEVVGMGIAGFSWNTLSPANNWHWSIQILATFILFRIFDILKPPPCRQLDRWSHGHSRLHGVGVMVDDVAAGFYALGVWQVVVAVGALLSGGQ